MSNMIQISLADNGYIVSNGVTQTMDVFHKLNKALEHVEAEVETLRRREKAMAKQQAEFEKQKKAAQAAAKAESAKLQGVK